MLLGINASLSPLPRFFKQRTLSEQRIKLFRAVVAANEPCQSPQPNPVSACANERKIRLCDVLGKGGKAEYTYDFGDSWEHALLVEKILSPEEGQTYPLCIDGKRHGPPEDCGGIGGFYSFLEAIGDPDHEEHNDMLEWIGGNFDPEAFSVDAVNDRLRQMFRVRPR